MCHWEEESHSLRLRCQIFRYTTCPFIKCKQRLLDPLKSSRGIFYEKAEVRRWIIWGGDLRYVNQKELGGLRMRCFKERNTALLGKWL